MAAKKLKVAIVGPGALGSSLALALRAKGYPITALVTRNPSSRHAARLSKKVKPPLVRWTEAPFDADLIWICVPDDAIAGCARDLSGIGDWKGRIVFHASGALSSSELRPLSRRGALCASVHPMMTFPRGVERSFVGVPFALEGDAIAVRRARAIARDLGATSFSIRKQDKALYHCWGSLASPLLVTLLAVTEQVAIESGVPRSRARAIMAPIARQTMENFLERGAAAAFTGPLARGDAETLRRHTRALRKLPLEAHVYHALSAAALELLATPHASRLRKALKGRN